MELTAVARRKFWKRTAIYVMLAVTGVIFYLAILGAAIEEIFHPVGWPAEAGCVSIAWAPNEEEEAAGGSLKRDVNTRILYSEVPELVTESETKTVYFADIAECRMIQAKSKADGTDPVYSFPEKLVGNKTFGTKLGKILGDVRWAKAPKDGAKEAVISETVAQREGIGDADLGTAVITVNGTEYTVVGIGKRDKASLEILSRFITLDETDGAILISYEEGSNLGTYRYAAETYEEFVRAQDADEVDTLLFADPVSEQAVTDYLVERYPDCEVQSESAYAANRRQALWDQVLAAFGLILLPIAIYSIILFTVLRGSERKCFPIDIPDLDNDGRYAYRAAFLAQYIPYGVCFAVAGGIGIGVGILQGINPFCAVVPGILLAGMTVMVILFKERTDMKIWRRQQAQSQK
ncbi:MAG: ABC transporter permease [Lachnospiraceae bacterium]|nr:ABC transporter permease [Lachnospiraceae bacterium]